MSDYSSDADVTDVSDELVSTKGNDVKEDVAASEALLELQDTLETQNVSRVSFGSPDCTHNGVNSVESKM